MGESADWKCVNLEIIWTSERPGFKSHFGLCSRKMGVEKMWLLQRGSQKGGLSDCPQWELWTVGWFQCLTLIFQAKIV